MVPRQELRYLDFYYQHAQMSSYWLQKEKFFFLREAQTLCHSHSVCIYVGRHSCLDLQIQINNYLMYNMYLNFLTIILVCKKYTDLLHF